MWLKTLILAIASRHRNSNLTRCVESVAAYLNSARNALSAKPQLLPWRGVEEVQAVNAPVETVAVQELVKQKMPMRFWLEA